MYALCPAIITFPPRGRKTTNRSQIHKQGLSSLGKYQNQKKIHFLWHNTSHQCQTLEKLIYTQKNGI